jgi:outer membrane protein W
MMKKILWMGMSLLLAAGSALAAGWRIDIKGGYFSSENSTFRDVYGGAAKFGLAAGIDVAKNVSVWMGLDYLRKSGVLTVTEEETKVRLMPLTAGVRYEIPAGKAIRFHVGAGIQEVFFKEESVLGTVSRNALGFMLIGGGVYRLTDAIGAGLFISWSTCKMKNEDIEFKVGGLDVGGRIEFRF